MKFVPDAQTEFERWQCTDPLTPARYHELVRMMNLTGSKWDTQVGDTPTLASYAVTLPVSEWQRLAALAENLSVELGHLEAELQRRPELWSQLGLNPEVLRGLRLNLPWTTAGARVVRYDFHPTADGWKLSEVNSDVPGGFNEASTFTQRMADSFSGLKPAGDPLATLADALAASSGTMRRVALLCAPDYMDDWQVTSGLRDALQQREVTAIMSRPQQLTWVEGCAYLGPPERAQAIGCIYRFFQGEWLSRTPAEKWTPLLRGGLTPVCNPGVSILSESKRLPLLWDRLQGECPTWRRVLPLTAGPWVIVREGLSKWVLKAAYSNTGDNVASRGWQPFGVLARQLLATLIHPAAWVAQQRFHTLPLSTPEGPRYTSIGVYTINGKATGIYARLSPKPVIDYSASDVAILIRG